MSEFEGIPESRVRIPKWIHRAKPAVPQRWLLLLAGIMWSGVGVLLSTFAATWLVKDFTILSILIAVAGIGISIAANRFMFSNLARKNIQRIQASVEKPCLFSFQAWTGYLIIAVMMTTGILLRNSSIPKPWLAVVYLSIGGALFQASIHYYRNFFHSKKEENS